MKFYNNFAKNNAYSSNNIFSNDYRTGFSGYLSTEKKIDGKTIRLNLGTFDVKDFLEKEGLSNNPNILYGYTSNIRLKYSPYNSSPSDFISGFQIVL